MLFSEYSTPLITLHYYLWQSLFRGFHDHDRSTRHCCLSKLLTMERKHRDSGSSKYLDLPDMSILLAFCIFLLVNMHNFCTLGRSKYFQPSLDVGFKSLSQGVVAVQNSSMFFFWSLVGWFHRHVEALRKWSWTIRKFWEISWRNLYKACDISILYAFKLMLFNLKSTWFLGCLTAFFFGQKFWRGWRACRHSRDPLALQKHKKNNPFSKNIARCAVH